MSSTTAGMIIEVREIEEPPERVSYPGVASALDEQNQRAREAAQAQAEKLQAQREQAAAARNQAREQATAKLHSLVAGSDARVWIIALGHMILEMRGVPAAGEAVPSLLSRFLSVGELGLAQAEQREESLGSLPWQESRSAIAHALVALEAALPPVTRDRERWLQAAEDALAGLPGGAWNGRPVNPLGSLVTIVREVFDQAVAEQVGAVAREKDATIHALVTLAARARKGLGVMKALGNLTDDDEAILAECERQVALGGTSTPASNGVAPKKRASKPTTAKE